MADKYQKFLPDQLKEGSIGYYPTSAEEWQHLPAVFRTHTHRTLDGRRVATVIFSVWFDEVKMLAGVEVPPEFVFKCLFCKSQQPRLQEVVAVRWVDGCHSYAKKKQDRKTGAFTILVNSTPVLMQGGYNGHIPANCSWDDASGIWIVNPLFNLELNTYYCPK